MNNDLRGTGRTAKQIEQAPYGSVFVWCTSDVRYALDTAHRLGRTDLTIKPLGWLDAEHVLASGKRQVVVDHAAVVDRALRVIITTHNARYQPLPA